MSDLVVLVIIIAVSCGAAAGLTALFARYRPAWRRRALILAAFAVTGPIILFMLVWVVHAIVTQIIWPDRCGVDACGMAMVFGTIGTFWLFVVSGLAALSALATRRLLTE